MASVKKDWTSGEKSSGGSDGMIDITCDFLSFIFLPMMCCVSHARTVVVVVVVGHQRQQHVLLLMLV